MNLRLSLMVAAALFTVSACATNDAQTASNTEVDAVVENASAPSSAAVQEVDEADESRIICKRQVVTGSRFAKNICMTWAEWKDREQTSKDYTKNTLRRATQQGNPQGG